MHNDTASVLILGSGTTSITPERGSPGLLLNFGVINILMDSGCGTLYRMALAGHSIYEIDMVCYTHLHPDHVSDLLPLLHSIKWDPSRPSSITRIRLLGPRSVIDYYNSSVKFWGKAIASDKERLIVQSKVMGNTKEMLNDIKLFTRFVKHTPDSISYRIEYQGVSVVYSGDTDMCESIKSLSEDCDLLIIECSFPSNRKARGHLSPNEIKEITQEANPRKVVLTHIYPGWSEAEWKEMLALAQSGKCIIGQDFMLIRLSRNREPSVRFLRPKLISMGKA